VIEWGRVGYTFFMLLATGVAGWLYRRNQASSELRSGQKLGIAIGGIIGATFAAKVPFILTSDPSAGVLAAWFGDGKTVLWGLAGGYVGVEVAKWSLYVRGRTGNRFVVPVAAAIAIGRLGCLFNGCCYGIPTDQSWGVRSIAADGGVLLRHPAPLYESFFHAAFAVVAAIAIRRGWWPTRWMLIYLVSYCVFRFFSEYWRVEPVVAFALTFYQLSAAVMGIVFTLLLLFRIQTAPQ
jgi:prolipoprotein diacylglyceryltransferase